MLASSQRFGFGFYHRVPLSLHLEWCPQRPKACTYQFLFSIQRQLSRPLPTSISYSPTRMLYAAVNKHKNSSNVAAGSGRLSASQSQLPNSQVSASRDLSAHAYAPPSWVSAATGPGKPQIPKHHTSSQRPGPQPSASSWSKSVPTQASFGRQSSFKAVQQSQQPLNPSPYAINLSKQCHGSDEKFLSALNGTSGFETTSSKPRDQAPLAPPPVSALEKLHEAVYFDENDFEDEINFDDSDDDIITRPASVVVPPPAPKATMAAVESKKLPKDEKVAVVPQSSQPLPWSSSPVNRQQSDNGLGKITQVVEIEDEIEEEVSKPRKARTLPWAGREEEEVEIVDSKSKQKPKSKRKIALATPAKKPLNFPMNINASATKKLTKESKIKLQNGKRANYSTAPDFEPASKKQRKTGTNDKNTKSDLRLSPEQKRVLDIIIKEGKSVFFTGSAGTGKSVLLRQIIEDLRKKFVKDPERVAVTASTGLAALNIGGVTLHSFAGIGLGKEAPELLIRKVRRSPKSKDRWLKTKVLVIDEVSMVDGELFDKLEAVAREVRKNSRPFGGIQLVVTGDFFQLPPVAESGRVSRFSFEAKTWGTCISHTVALTQIFRQKDPVFAGVLNEMRIGQLKDESVALFKTLSRPVIYDDGLEATELFPTRNEVERANRERLQRLPGPSEFYKASDTCAQGYDEKFKEKLLSNLMAPKDIELRKDAQVMLIKNIDETLVNGSLGKILGFMTQKDYDLLEGAEFMDEEMDSKDVQDPKRADLYQKFSATSNKADTSQKFPLVQFRLTNGCYRVFLVSTETWKIETPTGEIQAQRVQIPLILSWALSIHKSQGQTLERVKVDLNKVFEKGQAYVALSRATSKDRLQVLNFDRRRVMVHDKVSAFYRNLQDAHLMGEARQDMKTAARPEQQTVDLDEDDEDDYDSQGSRAVQCRSLGGARQQSSYFN